MLYGARKEVFSICLILFMVALILGGSAAMALAQDAPAKDAPKPVNVCTLIGNLTKDVYVNEAGTFAAARLAVNNYAGKDEAGKPIYKPMFIDVVFFGDNIAKAKELKKGDRIEVSGRLELREKKAAAVGDEATAAETKGQQRGDTHRIVARTMEFIHHSTAKPKAAGDTTAKVKTPKAAKPAKAKP